MDSAADIALCKKLLDHLENVERISDGEKLFELEHVFNHLPPQTAPRLQQDLNKCLDRSEKLLGNLFDKIDITDKVLLNYLIRLLLAYGNLRLALITYHIETARDEIDFNIRCTPILVKARWYDPSPLIPNAGCVGWKSILSNNLIRDPNYPTLSQSCIDILKLKLHFYATIQHLERFKKQAVLIHDNAHRVAERISESIYNDANDDQEVVTLDPFTYNLLFGFISVEQQKALIESIIVARFKSSSSELSEESLQRSNKQLDLVITQCIMNKVDAQEIFFSKMVDQLRSNLIRKKRCHYDDLEGEDDQEEEEEENERAKDAQVTRDLEEIFQDVINNVPSLDILLNLLSVRVPPKNLQRLYLLTWVTLADMVIAKKSLTAKSATMLLNACAAVLVTCSEYIDTDINGMLCLLLAKIVDSTSHKKLDKLFQTYNPDTMAELTRLFAESTSLLNKFETPLKRFYKSYFGKHMRVYTMRHYQKEAERFSSFIEFICTKTVGQNQSVILRYIYLCELSDFLEGIKTKSKIVDTYINYGRTIAEGLYSFIKERPFTKQTDIDEIMDVSQTNGCDTSQISEEPISSEIQAIVIDVLVCVFKIAVDCKEQNILETYGELMLKLYNHMADRLGELIHETRDGSSCEFKPIDNNLHRLINLYALHKEIIKPYLCYDLNKNICERLLIDEETEIDPEAQKAARYEKKRSYENIKTKLESMQKKDDIVFQTIINRQYTSAIDQNLGSVGDITRKENCAKHYLEQMAIMTDVLAIALDSCDYEIYENVLTDIAKQFGWCDALDHPRVLNLLHTLAALIPKNTGKDSRKADTFKKTFPIIGCSLIRFAKTVELGPSVLSFSNPGTHRSSGGIQCCTYANCIRVYTLIFNRFPPTFTNPLITDAMQLCVSANLIRYAKSSNKLYRFFIQLASAIAHLLKAICMGKRNIVGQAMPIFLSVLSLLIRCIILISESQKLEELPENHINGYSDDHCSSTKRHKSNGKDKSRKQIKIYESQLECLARDVGRLLNNLCFLETKLVDYAPHLISSYLKDTQRASCPALIKKHLDEGIFRIFNLIDSYQKDRLDQITDAGIQRKTTAGRASGSVFDMIHARLDQASREIFKDMHDNYNRFHRYLGRC